MVVFIILLLICFPIAILYAVFAGKDYLTCPRCGTKAREASSDSTGLTILFAVILFAVACIIIYILAS